MTASNTRVPLGDESGNSVQCPVCRVRCPAQTIKCACGWLLSGDYVLGDVTPAQELAFEARLNAAIEDHQRRLAAIAAWACGRYDADLASRLVRLGLRQRFPNGDADVGDIETEPGARPLDTLTGPGRDVPGGWTPPDPAALSALLRRLADADIESLTFVEFGAQAVTATSVIVAPVGVAVIAATQSSPWSVAVPGLSLDSDELWLQLAGGDIGPTPEPSRLPAAMRASLPGALTAMAEAPTVLVHRTRGLPLLDIAASVARSCPAWPIRSGCLMTRGRCLSWWPK